MVASSRERAEHEIARIASRAEARTGICAIHLQSAERIELKSEDPFPLASTYKLPIAIRLLKRVEEGQLSLDQMIKVHEEDLSPGSGAIKELFTIPGLELSIRNLLRLSFHFSDNTASDILFSLAGEGDEVTKMLASDRIDGIRVDRSTKRILCDFHGLSDLALQKPWSLKNFQARLREADTAARQAGVDAFLRDPRDCGTPQAVASLIAMLAKEELLSPLHTNLLLDLMRSCRTGPGRLKGQLPTGTVVAHKTGTIEGAVVNDAGIIELPDGRGRFVIAAFVQSTQCKVPELEAVIAQAARTVYDCFLLSE
jgi:beta-lactamase class A